MLVVNSGLGAGIFQPLCPRPRAEMQLGCMENKTVQVIDQDLGMQIYESHPLHGAPLANYANASPNITKAEPTQ